MLQSFISLRLSLILRYALQFRPGGGLRNTTYIIFYVKLWPSVQSVQSYVGDGTNNNNNNVTPNVRFHYNPY
jgi:hypothetical protein